MHNHKYTLTVNFCMYKQTCLLIFYCEHYLILFVQTHTKMHLNLVSKLRWHMADLPVYIHHAHTQIYMLIITSLIQGNYRVLFGYMVP